MGFLFARDGSLSVIRVSLLAVFIGGIFIVASLIAFQVDQQTRRTPLFIELPQGAESWGVPRDIATGWRETYYRVPEGNFDEIARFYARKMVEHYATGSEDPNAERCLRFPPTGEYTNNPNLPGGVLQPGFVPGESIAVSWRCLFDRSTDLNQWTQVTIYPGLANPDPLLNSAGHVVIVYEQRWQAQ